MGVSRLRLLDYQEELLCDTDGEKRVAYYLDMGLGKTFVGAEKMRRLGNDVNLVVCQKSKVEDWVEHFQTYYPEYCVLDMTDNRKIAKQAMCDFWLNYEDWSVVPSVLIINYELLWRRKELKELEHFTLMLDESSLIQNENAKRSKFVLKMKPDNVILLSGTPTGGKYERLWSQMRMLGWQIDKKVFYDQYVDFHFDDSLGFPRLVIDGYKNVDRLKFKMRLHGCRFLRTEEVMNLPDQIHQKKEVGTTKEYRTFLRSSMVNVAGDSLIGDTPLTHMLRERQLCGMYNPAKLLSLMDIVDSTDDRIVIFYNFADERWTIEAALKSRGRPVSVVSGKRKDLESYKTCSDSVTLIQYQAGAMGLNLQHANKIVYFTPPLSSELFEQSKKRIHRVGQSRTCFYYYLVCKKSIEERIYDALEMRRDYTERLFCDETNG